MTTTEQTPGVYESRSMEEQVHWAFGRLARHDLSAPDEIWAPHAFDHFLFGGRRLDGGR